MNFSSSVDVISRVLDAADEAQLLAELNRATRDMGFESVIFGMELKRPLLPSLLHICSGYPPAWQRRYAEGKYIMADPTVQHCLTSTEPLVWTEKLHENSRVMWEEARMHGISHGISVPVHGRDGVKSMVSLARDQSVSSPHELAAITASARVLANCAHVVASRILAPPLVANDPRLTPRELECLGWAARGKTAAEIAMILRISEATAIHHLNNVVRKFNVANRMQAVAVAVSMGLVS